ncbi:MAG: hypothetical protein RMJ54_14995 [Roseiflexaceae bacterium]|nr:hypothetical protein [Roseiflexaceae bacterium]
MDSIRCIARSLLMIATIIALASCGGSKNPPSIGEIKIVPKTINVRETATLSADTLGAVAYKWEASRGMLATPTGPSTDYTAPDTPGPVTISLTVKGADGTSTTRSITIEVIGPTPTVSSALTAPIVTLTTTSVVAIPPLADVFPQAAASGGEVFRFTNPPGEFKAAFSSDDTCRFSGQYGLAINFNFSISGEGDRNGGWGVQWDNAPDKRFDASSFKNFTFMLRGNAPNNFHVAMKSTDGKEFWINTETYGVAAPDVWQQVSIPLAKFAGVNMSSLQNVSFGFNRDHDQGAVCIDEIAFR